MKIIRQAEVKAKTTLSSWAIYEGMRAGTFPQSVQLGPNTVGWVEAEVNSWIKSRRRGPLDFETLNPSRRDSRKPKFASSA